MAKFTQQVLVILAALFFLPSCTYFRSSRQSNNLPPTPLPQSTNRLPAPTGFVNDYANVIDVESKSRLESLFTTLKAKSNIEFAVVTVDTTKGEPISDYSLAVAREWGIGPKNPAEGGGLLLMLAIKDRQWRLQVSRSLEKDLPNDVSQKLAEPSVEFYKAGNYGAGIEKYATALINRLEKQRNFSIE
ncbi:MAG TPA: TPM domain-containing protein [Pyrinomonadaceae bacterium]